MVHMVIFIKEARCIVLQRNLVKHVSCPCFFAYPIIGLIRILSKVQTHIISQIVFLYLIFL